MNTVIYISGNQTALTAVLKSHMEAHGFRSVESAEAAIESTVLTEKSNGHIVACVLILGVSLTKDSVNRLKTIVENGTPLIFSEQSSGAVAALSSIGFNFGLFENVEQEISGASATLYGVGSAQEVFTISGLTTGGTVNVAESTGWKLAIQESLLHTSTVPLAKIQNSSGLVVSAYAPKGASTLLIPNLGATVVLAGFLYSSINVKGCEVFRDLVNLCLRDFAKYKVSGFVKDGDENPLERTLRLYAKSTGELLDSTVSSEVDGSYQLESNYSGDVAVVCVANSNDENNSQIADKVRPRLVV